MSLRTGFSRLATTTLRVSATVSLAGAMSLAGAGEPTSTEDSRAGSQASDSSGSGSPALEAELLRVLSDKDFDDQGLDTALSIVARIDIEKTDSTQTLAAIIQTARKGASVGRRDETAEVYHTAAALCEKQFNHPVVKLPAEKAVAIWNTAAGALVAVGRGPDALRWLTLAADQSGDRVTMQRTGELLLSVASGALDSGDKLTAGNAYRVAMETFERDGEDSSVPGLATARLGYAWTLVMAAGESNSADHLRQSLAAVETFLAKHPEHADVATARLLRLSCQTRLGDEADAAVTREQLVRLHPQFPATAELVARICQTQNVGSAKTADGLALDAADTSIPATGLSEPIQQYLIEHYAFLLSTPSCRANVNVAKCGLLTAAMSGAPEAETAYAAALSLSDETGDAATDTLERLHAGGHDAAAQRIAMGWLAVKDATVENANSLIATMQSRTGILITEAVREAACRWAGRNGHWSMLAMAAADEPGLYDRVGGSGADHEASEQETFRRGRSLHVERLFAEALLQSGKTQQSLKLWQRIVDDRGADDFPTLLRLAETAVSAGAVTEASKRIAAAEAAAMQPNNSPGGGGRSSAEVASTHLLAANLEIRQLRFDHGRARLEQIVRSSRADADLRGRAQWLIGETFFMQEKFPQAIAAYRQVEAIGSSDQWTAAALVQAGKSFEQLGRTRDAAVCYSNLVSRFGDSPHAGGARRRLAALSTDGPSPPGTIRR